MNKPLTKEYFLDLSKKLYFEMDDCCLDELVSFTNSLSDDLTILTSMPVDDLNIFYCHSDLSLSLDKDWVQSETDSTELLTSLTDAYEILNIELQDQG